MMSKPLFAIFLASLAFAFTTGKQQEQQTEYNKQAEIDANGNIYVSLSSALGARRGVAIAANKAVTPLSAAHRR